MTATMNQGPSEKLPHRTKPRGIRHYLSPKTKMHYYNKKQGWNNRFYYKQNTKK